MHLSAARLLAAGQFELPRKTLILATALGVATQYIAFRFQAATLAHTGFADQFVHAIGSFNVFQVFAYVAALRLIFNGEVYVKAGSSDFALTTLIALGAGLAGATGEILILDIAVSLAAIIVFRVLRNDRNERAAAFVFGALTLQAIWGPWLFALTASEILRVETFVVGSLLHLLSPAVVWNGSVFVAPDAHSIIVIEGCSAFANILLAMLCWTSMTMWDRQYWRTTDIFIGLAMYASVVAVNTLRLCLMAQSASNYQFLHNSPGATLIGLIVTVMLPAFCWSGLQLTERRP